MKMIFTFIMFFLDQRPDVFCRASCAKPAQTGKYDFFSY
jgi:hypothetical protein